MDINKFKNILLMKLTDEESKKIVIQEHEKAIIQMQKEIIQEMGS